MNDAEAIKQQLNNWLVGLDSGDLEAMLETCHPQVITCNEYQPTALGLEGIRDKYAPRIESATFSSGFDIQQLEVLDDFAIVVGRYSIEATNKEFDHRSNANGRLVLGYSRDEDGTWKMVLDVDNNDDTDGSRS